VEVADGRLLPFPSNIFDVVADGGLRDAQLLGNRRLRPAFDVQVGDLLTTLLDGETAVVLSGHAISPGSPQRHSRPPSVTTRRGRRSSAFRCSSASQRDSTRSDACREQRSAVNALVGQNRYTGGIGTMRLRQARHGTGGK